MAAIVMPEKGGGSSDGGPSRSIPPDEVPIQATKLQQWDAGLFDLELIRRGIVPEATNLDPKKSRSTDLCLSKNEPDPIKNGTFSGTQKAISAMYSRTESSFSAHYHVAGFEPRIPLPQPLPLRKDIFTYQKPGSDPYPPHLHLIPKTWQDSLTQIFNWQRLLDTSTLLTQLIPDVVEDFIHSDPFSDTLEGLTKRNQELRAQKKDVFKEPNIGDRNDWYADRIFAQQFFSGTNAVTVERISSKLLDEFLASSKAQEKADVTELLQTVDSADLYVQDYSYFRKAVGADPDAELHSPEDVRLRDRIKHLFVRNDDMIRYLPASVCLFHLESNGELHPLGIVVDYKESMNKSVVLFNRRVQSSSKVAGHDQATDWPWRYAKTCVQVSDWTRHELTVHLTNAHFVEEAAIVATQRCFELTHPVYNLLQPHWYKTLSLNANARSVLVPSVINKVAGISVEQIHNFINDAYDTFDWTANYVPNDLQRRGFSVEEVGKDEGKYRKYMYARNMLDVWNSLRKFVLASLQIEYPSDSSVQQDSYVQSWAKEMRSDLGAKIKTFPDGFKTVDELADAVTMCIHIASPQHTAVNYLQDYYQSFVVNKPPCLCKPPPTSLDKLKAYGEPDLMKAIPVNAPRVWLLASHLPYLLSYKVAGDQNLITYARSLQKLCLERDPSSQSAATKAAETLLNDLIKMGATFSLRSEMLVRDGHIGYDVLDPVLTANSILI